MHTFVTTLVFGLCYNKKVLNILFYGRITFDYSCDAQFNERILVNAGGKGNFLNEVGDRNNNWGYWSGSFATPFVGFAHVGKCSLFLRLLLIGIVNLWISISYC